MTSTPGALDPAHDEATWATSWEGALAALELDVDRAEALLRDPLRADAPEPAPWSPPSGLGPLPADLVDRAKALLDRQMRVAHDLTSALARTRRQHALTHRIETGDDGGRPLYVDQAY